MIEMTERCHCGANLIAGLAFCVTCGDRRPALVGAGLAQDGGTRAGRPQGRPADLHRPSNHAAPSAHPSLPPTPVAQPYPVASYVPARSSAPWIVGGAAIVVGAVVVVVVVVVALFLLTLRPSGEGAPVAVAQPATVVVPSTTTVTAAPVTSVSSSVTGSTSLLSDQVDTDRAAVEDLAGSWVPQLSSKRVGTVADGITYGADDILGHYRGLAATYPQAELLYSGDWPVFNGADYWVVVVAEPFSTPAAANSWCSAHGFARDDCFAKQLSHSGRPAGSTVQR